MKISPHAVSSSPLSHAGPTPPPSPGGARSVTLWVYGNIIAGAGQLDGVIAQLQPHAASFSSIAYQCYGVGDDGSFQARWQHGFNNSTNRSRKLAITIHIFSKQYSIFGSSISFVFFHCKVS